MFKRYSEELGKKPCWTLHPFQSESVTMPIPVWPWVVTFSGTSSVSYRIVLAYFLILQIFKGLHILDLLVL